MPNQQPPPPPKEPEIPVLDRILIQGDLSVLSAQERVEYVLALCKSLGLNPLSKPFDYMELGKAPGKDSKKQLILYAKRDCTDQLRKIHEVSIKIIDRELVDGVYCVRTKATMPSGREDEAIGAVPFVKEGGRFIDTGQTWPDGNKKTKWQPDGTTAPLSAEDRAHGMMRAETKAKRRVTLSLCGLGIMDETEAEELRDRKFSVGDEIEAAHAAADAKAEADPGTQVRKKTPAAAALPQEETAKPTETPAAAAAAAAPEKSAGLSDEEKRNAAFLREQEDKKQKAAAKRAAWAASPASKLQTEVGAMIPGSTARHFQEFYQGWFDGTWFGETKLPEDCAEFVRPLQRLQRIAHIPKVQAAILDDPRQFGNALAADAAEEEKAATTETTTEAIPGEALLEAEAIAILLHHNRGDARLLLKDVQTGKTPHTILEIKRLIDARAECELTMENTSEATKNAVTSILGEVRA